jgi:hypothetical protein
MSLWLKVSHAQVTVVVWEGCLFVRNKSAHQQAEKHLDGEVGGAALDECLRACDDGPAADDERNPDISAELFADETAGKFCREEANKEDLGFTILAWANIMCE